MESIRRKSTESSPAPQGRSPRSSDGGAAGADRGSRSAKDQPLWAQLFGTETAHIVAMVIGYAIVFSGATLVADGWRRIHRARREDKLMTDGVYGRMRHPQYAGLFLIVFGEGIVHWPTIISVAAFPTIVFAYAMLARKEERQMLEKFGDEYREYQRRVPMFIPRFEGSHFKEA